MPRILGVDIPENKPVRIALTYIYGIGHSSADEICRKSQIDPSIRARDLAENDISAITGVLQESYTVEGDLRRQTNQNLRRLIAIGSYKGMRHKRGLPANGQQTQTNARTRKGSKKTVGAIRDRAARRMSG